MWLNSLYILWLLPKMAMADPTFGPEVEFRGKKQLKSMACAATLYPQSARAVQRGSKKAAKTSMAATGSSALVMGAAIVSDPINDSAITDYALAASITTMIASGAASGAGFIYNLYCPEIRMKADRAYDAKLEAALKALCEKKECELSTKSRNAYWDYNPYKDFTITYPDGFEVHFTHDPSVIEVKTNAITAESLQKNTARLQSDVWDLLRGIGLKPPKLDGPWNGGHLHVGVNESFRDVKHLKDFLRDLLEHPELGEGIFANDAMEAPSPRVADGGYRLRQAIENLDRYPDDHPVNSQRIKNILAHILPKNAYGVTYNFKFGTIELRFIRSQKDAVTLERLTRLLRGRIFYLRDNPYTKPLASMGEILSKSTITLDSKPAEAIKALVIHGTDLASSPNSDAEKIAAFRQYVEEAGESWDEFQEILPTYLQRKFGNFSARCADWFRKISN